MPRSLKTRVCTETEKRKAEIFNKIDDLINKSRWNEALENLFYLHRNSPSLRLQINQKLAWLYYENNNPKKSLEFLEQLIPTKNFGINRMILENLIQLNERKRAIYHLAKAPLNSTEKKKLLSSIFPMDKKATESLLGHLTIRCSKCTRFLFFINDQARCLFCDETSLR